MKIWNAIIKITLALAAIAGIIYLAATYGDKIVAWAKKLLGRCGCSCPCDDDCENCNCTDDCENCPCDCGCDACDTCDFAAEEAEEEVAPVEEAVAEEGAVVAEAADFEG